MNNNQLQLVTFEQAKRLKQAGFDWPTNHWYNDPVSKEAIGKDFDSNFNIFIREGWDMSVPTVALALKWIRDIKDLDSGIEPIFDPWSSCMCYRIHIVLPSGNKETKGAFYDFDEAEIALLDELLTLIERWNH